MTQNTAGYSGTPLAKKLTLKDGMRVWFANMPHSIRADIAQYGLSLIEEDMPVKGMDAAHIFVTDEDTLHSLLSKLAALIDPAGQIWVSWPKKASKIPTQVDQASVQATGLNIGLVDTKKCAVDTVWSGLKFVIRKENR